MHIYILMYEILFLIYMKLKKKKNFFIIKKIYQVYLEQEKLLQ